jgi:hypothetical protein
MTLTVGLRFRVHNFASGYSAASLLTYLLRCAHVSIPVQLRPGVPPHQNKRNTKSHPFLINTIKDLLNVIDKRLYRLIISILEKYLF